MSKKIIYDDGKHSWIFIGRDPSRPGNIIDTNEYLIVNGDQGMLLDPGGSEIFPQILNEISEIIDVKNIQSYLCSHQDPDIMSSLPLWMALNPQAKIYVSWLWGKFISHFGNHYADQFVEVPDEGMEIKLNNQTLQLIPAHYCHSSGNFNLYDPLSKILFSGDLGSALVPWDYPVEVQDFNDHIKYMESFHVRWMPSNEAKNRWVRRVRRLDVQMICPQHGAIFKDENVGKFLNWLESLEVGKTRE
jgi:flavorubredoxin